jgi:hypothetical protein
MTALTLKSLPDKLVESLRASAEAAHRSLNKEVIHRLERSFETPAMKANEEDFRVREQVAAWTKIAGSWQSDASIDEEIDALYAARTPGRDVEL